MSIALLINIVIALLIAGFLYWAATQLVNLIPMPPVLSQAVHALLIIIVVAIVLFWVVIPLLQVLGNLHLPEIIR